VKEGVVEGFYTPATRYILRGISAPETTDSLYVGTPVAQFTRTPTTHTHHIYK